MAHLNPKARTNRIRQPNFDRRAHSRFVIPTRMGYRWRHFNHRIAVWKFGLAANGGGHPWADTLQAHSVGGPFSDGLGRHERPRVKFGFQRIEADSIRRIGAARRRLFVTLDSTGAVEGRNRFDRDDLNLRGYRNIVAIITGFGFDTSIPQSHVYPTAYNPGHGYLTRGLGASVRVTDLTDESVEIGYTLRYGFGASMDRPHHNEALLEARVGAELDITLVATDEVPIHRGDVHYELEYDEPKIAVQQQIEPAPQRLQRIELDGEPSAPAGVFGIQSFNFELAPGTSCQWNRNWPYGDQFRGEEGAHPKYGAPGYYIRELTIDLRREDYDRATGRGSFLFDGYASNATRSIPFHPLRSVFTGSMVWLQADATTETVDFESEFETGSSEFHLDDMTP